MSSLHFLRFAKFHLVFREIYKPAPKINEKAAYKLHLPLA
jgi:hypothetical protein